MFMRVYVCTKKYKKKSEIIATTVRAALARQ